MYEYKTLFLSKEVVGVWSSYAASPFGASTHWFQYSPDSVLNTFKQKNNVCSNYLNTFEIYIHLV